MITGKKIIVVFLVLFVFVIFTFADEIHDAAKEGDLAKVKELLDKNPELIHAKDQDGDTPLHLAAFFGRAQMAELLIAKGAKLMVKNSVGITPLSYSVRNMTNEVTELLLQKSTEFNYQDFAGFNPLHYAVIRGYKELVEALIIKGAQLNHQDIRGRTPLHYAVCSGDKEIVKVLIKNGADMNIKDQDGQTPFVIAIDSDCKEVIDLMVKNDAVTKIKEDNRNIILHKAASKGYKRLVELFMAKGANIYSKGTNGETLLHSVASGGLIELAKLMIKKGIDVNTKDSKGRTALHNAVKEGRKEMIELLIAKGLDINLKGSDGRTPLHIAEDWNHKNIKELLRAKGAKEIPREVHILETRHQGQIETEKEIQVSSPIEIYYIANEGVLVSSTKQKILIEGVQKNSWLYPSTPKNVFQMIMSKQLPFENIDLLLITHFHRDHFEPQMAVQLLLVHPETMLISFQKVMDQLKESNAEYYDKLKHQLKNVNPKLGSTLDMKIKDIAIKIIGLNHDLTENKPLMNLAYIINIEGIKLIHLADTYPPSNEEYFESLNLEQEEIDIALVPDFILLNPIGQKILKDHIKPQLIIPIHIADINLENTSQEIKKFYPNAIFFKESMEKKIFKKN